MFDGPIVDVAIGLIFFYVVLSLICSAVQELVASALALRSKNLEKGISNLLGSEYANKVYEHPLIKHLSKPGQKPSYVRPSIFAAGSARRAREAGGREERIGTEFGTGSRRAGQDGPKRTRPRACSWVWRAQVTSPSTRMERCGGRLVRRGNGSGGRLVQAAGEADSPDHRRVRHGRRQRGLGPHSEQLWYHEDFRAAVVEAAEPLIRESVKEDQASRVAEGANGGEAGTPSLNKRLEKLKGISGPSPSDTPRASALMTSR